jgi:AhpD family alkylhydroperoxidase
MTTTDSDARINIFHTAPEIHRGMAAFQRAAADGLDPQIGELVKIRCSQINKCAFCLDMHVTDARKLGVDQLKLDLLPAWEETPGLYSARERAALALAEAITQLTDGFVPDDVYARAAEQFDEAELSRLIAQIVAINAWNRFQVTTRATPASLT